MRKKKGGYGLVYQDIMRCPEITPEAKAIYAYLSSIAGNSDECYPSRDLMSKELAMSKNRLDKHLAILVSNGVVKKTRLNLGNLKSRNIYKITHESQVHDELKDIFRGIENKDIENKGIENEYSNINSTNNNRLNNNRAKPTYYSRSRSFCQANDGQMADKCQTDDGIGKDRIGKDKIENTICASDNAPKASKSAINDFFESIWKLYPCKKGKGQVSDAKKKALYDIGYDELSRAIDRYKSGLAKEEWRKPQNGSTFFNSGYVDYLDANYSDPECEETDSERPHYRTELTEEERAILMSWEVPEDAPFK